MGSFYRAGLLTLAVIGFGSPMVVSAQIANEPWEGPEEDAITNNIGFPSATPANLGTSAQSENTGAGFGTGWSTSASPPAAFPPGWQAITGNRTRIAIINDPAAPLGTVNSADLNYLSFTNSDVPPVTFASGKRILRLQNINDPDVVYRLLAGPVDDDSIFFSFLFKVEAGSINDNDTVYFWFDDEIGTDHEDSPQIGYNASNGAGDRDIVVRMSTADTFTRATDAAADLGLTVPSSTLYIVGNLYKSTPGAANFYDRFALWVNPNNSELGTPEVTASISPGRISSFNLVGIRTEAVDTTDVYLIDGPRLGNWTDLVPPPGSPPLAVDLIGLEAVRDGGSVNITWKTTAELDTAGFKVFRADAHGQRGEAITASLVPAEGSAAAGADYSVADASPSTFASYFLVEVELDGSENVYGPVTVAGDTAPASSSVGNWSMY